MIMQLSLHYVARVLIVVCLAVASLAVEAREDVLPGSAPAVHSDAILGVISSGECGSHRGDRVCSHVTSVFCDRRDGLRGARIGQTCDQPLQATSFGLSGLNPAPPLGPPIAP